MQVYADNAATTRMHQTAIDTMTYHLNHTFGNPSSLYTIGQQAKEVLETARADMAACFGAQPREIYFTSGGSEADNQAITSAAYIGARKGKKHIISTTFEHHAVLHTLKRLEKQGFEVTLLDVHADGLVTAQQVAVLFLLIGTGMVAVKTGVLKLENKQALSNLLVYIIVPAMVVNSYRMEFSAQILHNLLAAFGMSVLSVLLGTVITLLLTARKTGSRMPIFRFACIFSNAAYMGFPLISALFGSEGLLYASAYVTVFNILLWTLGYGLVSGGSSVKEVARSLVRTPVLYAIVVGLGIYLLQIPLPALITQPLELLAGVNTPLSMLITGMLIAAGDVRSIVTDKHIWKLASVRMLLIPVATLALFGVLGFHGTAAQVVTLLECCPAAAITSVFAVQFGHDESFAAGSVVLTTLLSIVALPLCALVVTLL